MALLQKPITTIGTLWIDVLPTDALAEVVLALDLLAIFFDVLAINVTGTDKG